MHHFDAEAGAPHFEKKIENIDRNFSLEINANNKHLEMGPRKWIRVPSNISKATNIATWIVTIKP
jgi:hypothetical protein